MSIWDIFIKRMNNNNKVKAVPYKKEEINLSEICDIEDMAICILNEIKDVAWIKECLLELKRYDYESYIKSMQVAYISIKIQIVTEYTKM